jgi:hypothetical protein
MREKVKSSKLKKLRPVLGKRILQGVQRSGFKVQGGVGIDFERERQRAQEDLRWRQKSFNMVVPIVKRLLQ